MYRPNQINELRRKVLQDYYVERFHRRAKIANRRPALKDVGGAAAVLDDDSSLVVLPHHVTVLRDDLISATSSQTTMIIWPASTITVCVLLLQDIFVVCR